jgi:hypothetical protein
MEKGSASRRLFDLVTGDQVEWQRMADPFEKFVYPDFSFVEEGTAPIGSMNRLPAGGTE